MRASYMRLQKLHDGNEKFVRVPACSCAGRATQTTKPDGKMGWTEGQRGPRGGICGSCCGAIPTDDDK